MQRECHGPILPFPAANFRPSRRPGTISRHRPLSSVHRTETRDP
ncbi:hypothetical protein BTZ20_5586 [Rhodococcus sp. MTM3W5.2]|nr:hypothetical protein BTZ20_5586 [Rhodococcus sp. MTM3W5.2]